MEFVLTFAVMVAIIWVGYLNRKTAEAEANLAAASGRIGVIQNALQVTQDNNEELMLEVQHLKAILFDVALGDAHVWIEEGELRAARSTARTTQVH